MSLRKKVLINLLYIFITMVGIIVYNEIYGKFLMDFSLNNPNISFFLYCTMLAGIPFAFHKLCKLHIKKISC